MKYLAVLATAALVGCAVPSYNPPPSVAAMPNDCANRQAIINWLESQSKIPRQPLESEQNYEQSRAQIRHRLWHVRYVCQPA